MAQTPPKAANPLVKSKERIYTPHQLILALKSGMVSVREQLQVLSILDGTAASWPGMNQAVEDMDFLVEMSAQTTTRLESEIKTAETRAQEFKMEVMTLKETLSNSSQRCEELQQEVSQGLKEIRQLNGQLESSNKEVNQQRQELWTLEKQRADLASEVEKYKQDTEFMEGEIGTLRSTASEQLQQLTALKEELAARKADVQHLQQATKDHKAAATDLKRRLDSTNNTLRTTQSQLEHTRSDSQHFEKEAARLGEECTKLTAELSKTTTELQRLKDWNEVLKKVEADKLREEQAAHTRSRFESEQIKSELEKTIARLQAEVDGKDERVISKTAEAAGISKQFGLLNIQIKDLQKQLTTLQTEKNAMIKERDDSKTEVMKLQTKLQAANMQMARLDKEKVMVESKAKDMTAAERAKHQAASEEARKEGAVQRALADGWARDIKDLQNRLNAEQALTANLRSQIEALQRGDPEGADTARGKHTEMVKSLAVAEQGVKDLQAVINTKESELRRQRAEAASVQKRLEKHIESLQRECDECAAELQRYRHSDAGRLPSVMTRPVSLQDELDNLKRYVHHGPNGSVPAHLPPAVKKFKKSFFMNDIGDEEMSGSKEAPARQQQAVPGEEASSVLASPMKVPQSSTSTLGPTMKRQQGQTQLVQELQAQVTQLQAELAEAKKRIFESDQVRRKMHNIIQELKGNIRVFCRVRPLISSELASKEEDMELALEFPQSEDPITTPITLQSYARDGAGSVNRHTFAFDKVFDTEATQAAVFKEISELVQSALDGHKVCIFAYGQTGSGKTFTMMGDQRHPGIIPRAMKQIFEYSQQLEKDGWTFKMQVSMLEIYNEEYRDLLGDTKPETKLQVIHHSDGTASVTDLTVVDISQASRRRNAAGGRNSVVNKQGAGGVLRGGQPSASQSPTRKGLSTSLPDRVSALLAEAMQKRSVGCTALNEQSSRSHMVFTLRLEGENVARDKKSLGVLNLIDLAGSERVKDSGSTGIRLKEAQAINTSLSALGDVMLALGNKQQHIPYRNSKLTYLLQPSLGGDAKALMFVNIAPSMHFSGESLCSLRFAAKVNAVEINPKKKPQRHGSALSRPAIQAEGATAPTLEDV